MIPHDALPSMSNGQRRQRGKLIERRHLNSLEGLLGTEQLTGGDDLLPQWALDNIDDH